MWYRSFDDEEEVSEKQEQDDNFSMKILYGGPAGFSDEEILKDEE
jgi:hypothetical protein